MDSKLAETYALVSALQFIPRDMAGEPTTGADADRRDALVGVGNALETGLKTDPTATLAGGEVNQRRLP